MKNLFVSSFPVAAAAILLLADPSAALSATLMQVPVQNYGDGTSSWMIMPVVSYNAAAGRVQVAMPESVPQLTPLLASNPADGFDPADPWFDALDPSRHGASFSRRYGFVMDAMSDPLPDGAQMWIRKISGPANLRFYRYSGSAPKMFDPIFGTDGSTNALYWNGMMFHPAVAAPPATNLCSAVFEVFLRATTTGEEVPGSSSGPLGLDWTNVSDGRPALALSQGIVVAWPATTTTNWLLECSATLDTGAWRAVTNAPTLVGDEWRVILDPGAPRQFFRMRHQP